MRQMGMHCPVEITQALVQIPSVNPAYDPTSRGAAPVIDWVARWGSEHGFEVMRHPVPGGLENLVLRMENGPGKHLLFNGHFDTVSVGGMTVPPFDAAIYEGRLWGRGACDMKGPVAAMLVAALELKENPESWSGTLTLGFTPDEEVATAGIRALMTQIPTPDFAIVGEPTVLKPLRGCKGALRFALRCYGVAAHSSRPAKGKSAVVAMARAVVALNDYFTQELTMIARPQFETCTGSIGTIHGGTGINIVPDECAIQIDIRLIPGQQPEPTLAALKAWFHKAIPAEEGIRWEFEILHLDPPFEIAADHPFLVQVAELAGEPTPNVGFFCCDASKISEAGVPCLILGPGDIAQAHTKDESIELTQLPAGVALYRKIVETLLKKEG